jgi:hypothetical protein
MHIRKQDIYALDLEHWADLDNDQFLEALENSNLCNHSSWLLPQLTAHFGRWRLYSSGRDTVIKNCTTKLDKVFYRLTRARRSLLIKNQTQQPEYGQLTPLILCGFKRHQGYSYEQFRELAELKYILEPLLYDSLHDEIPQLSAQRLLEIRRQGLVYRSGKQSGKMRNPESTWQLFSIGDTELGSATKLLQSMLCQIWLAHPKHRRETMILDPNNWDQMPEPLIDQELFDKPQQKTATMKKIPKSSELDPWLDELKQSANMRTPGTV